MMGINSLRKQLKLSRTRIVPLNDMPDGAGRTIKAQYNNSSVANFIRHDAFAATGVVEIHETE